MIGFLIIWYLTGLAITVLAMLSEEDIKRRDIGPILTCGLFGPVMLAILVIYWSQEKDPDKVIMRKFGKKE